MSLGLIKRSKFIVAQLEREDRIHAIPMVVFSNHHRFTSGTRFDYAFLQIALDEGYSVLFIGSEVPERMAFTRGELGTENP
jgi:hypothetical protein